MLHLVFRALVVAVELVCFAGPASASLAGRLHHFIDRNGFPTHGDFNEAVTPIVERLALRAIDFPVTATTPAFTYRFDYETGVAVRTSESMGPTFAERADTVGRRQIALGIAYLHADVDQFDGHAFADDIETGAVVTAPEGRYGQAFAARTFNLESHVTTLSVTGGITDAWDLNLLFPVVATTLTLRGAAAAQFQPTGEPANPPVTERVGFAASAFGIGDIQVRTKWRFYDEAVARLAVALALRLPTGDARDFHGLGDTVLAPSLIASRPFGRHDAHLSVGGELNADKLARSRARYAAGITIQPWERVAFPIDVIGTSSFVDEEFTIRALRGSTDEFFGNDDLIQSVGRGRITAIVPRSDIVDLAVGVKIELVRTLVAHASVIVPLTRDGLRAEVIPTVGLEATY